MIPLFIPFVNRRDLLAKAALSVVHPDVEINIIDNSNGPSFCINGVDFIYRRPPVPLSFSQTQNWFLSIAEADSDYEPFYAFLHCDAEAEEGTISQLVHFARQCEQQERKWGAIFTRYDALAMFNTMAFQNIGGWDTMLSWYASDCDVYRRLRLAGYELIESGLPVKHEPSQTLKADPEIKRKVDLEIPFRESYYRAKHGGSPGHETFAVPFGGK